MSCRTVGTIADLRRHLARARGENQEIGLVPTMGAMHRGHAALIERARDECGVVAVSLFVNPTQFDRKDDFDRYARGLPADHALCDELGADFLFAPSVEEMYPRPGCVHVDPGKLADHLCGAFRPGHFRGVATVVAKLFHIVQPSRAYFGRKDGQQLAIIERMVADLDIPVGIVPVDTVREPSGLALSSRNERLSPEGRRSAAVLYRALCAARDSLERGSLAAVEALAAAQPILGAEPGVKVEYFEIVDRADLQPVAAIEGPVMIAIAAWVDGTRLIDNVTYG
ncbi:MAG: pantoate--beta-alanine ligase [Bryobacteraceae bacterium]